MMPTSSFPGATKKKTITVNSLLALLFLATLPKNSSLSLTVPLLYLWLPAQWYLDMHSRRWSFVRTSGGCLGSCMKLHLPKQGALVASEVPLVRAHVPSARASGALYTSASAFCLHKWSFAHECPLHEWSFTCACTRAFLPFVWVELHVHAFASLLLPNFEQAASQ